MVWLSNASAGSCSGPIRAAGPGDSCFSMVADERRGLARSRASAMMSIRLPHGFGILSDALSQPRRD